jgi:hypothetical protein
MLSRLIITCVGLACASAAGLVFLPLAVIFDPLVQLLTSDTAADHWFEILSGVLTDEDPEEAIEALFQLLWTIGMLVCVLPITIVALIGGIVRTENFAFYAGLTGFIAAAVPWILRGGRLAERSASISAAEAHLTVILFITGVIAGTIYWLIAGRTRSNGTEKGWMASYRSG